MPLAAYVPTLRADAYPAAWPTVSKQLTLNKIQDSYNSNKLCARSHHMSPPPQVDLWPFYLESGVRVTCDMGSLCANFSSTRPLCSRLRPDGWHTDRQTSDRLTSDEHHRIMPPPYGGGGIINCKKSMHYFALDFIICLMCSCCLWRYVLHGVPFLLLFVGL